MSESYLRFVKLNQNKTVLNACLLDNMRKLDDNIELDDYSEYYCANAVEKLFECNNILTYIKRGGFGLNYRYCASCYQKWDKLKLEPKVKGKCLIDVSKL